MHHSNALKLLGIGQNVFTATAVANTASQLSRGTNAGSTALQRPVLQQRTLDAYAMKEEGGAQRQLGLFDHQTGRIQHQLFREGTIYAQNEHEGETGETTGKVSVPLKRDLRSAAKPANEDLAEDEPVDGDSEVRGTTTPDLSLGAIDPFTDGQSALAINLLFNYFMQFKTENTEETQATSMQQAQEIFGYLQQVPEVKRVDVLMHLLNTNFIHDHMSKEQIFTLSTMMLNFIHQEEDLQRAFTAIMAATKSFVKTHQETLEKEARKAAPEEVYEYFIKADSRLVGKRYDNQIPAPLEIIPGKVYVDIVNGRGSANSFNVHLYMKNISRDEFNEVLSEVDFIYEGGKVMQFQPVSENPPFEFVVTLSFHSGVVELDENDNATFTIIFENKKHVFKVNTKNRGVGFN